MQGKMHDRVVEMRLCFFSGKVGDYKVLFKSTRKCRSTMKSLRMVSVEGKRKQIYTTATAFQKEIIELFGINIG